MIDAGLRMDDDSLRAAEERVASGVVPRVVTQGARRTPRAGRHLLSILIFVAADRC